MRNIKNPTISVLSLLIKQIIHPIIVAGVIIAPAWSVEFNTDMIDTEDKSNIDLSQFEKKGYIPVGQYIARVEINKKAFPTYGHLTGLKPTMKAALRSVLHRAICAHLVSLMSLFNNFSLLIHRVVSISAQNLN